MESVPAYKLKKGLSQIKKGLTEKIGPVYKLKKPQVISKIKDLGYDYNQSKNSLDVIATKAMKRKKGSIKL